MHIWYCLYFVATVLCRGNKKNQTRSMTARNILLAMLLNHFSSPLNMKRIFFPCLALSRVLWRQSCPLHWKVNACARSSFLLHFCCTCLFPRQPAHAVAGSNSSLKHTHPHWTALSDVDVSGCTVRQSCKVDRQCTSRTQLWTGHTQPVI